MNVDDVIRERIAKAKARSEAAKARRLALQANRQAGLIARHRAKLARLEAAEQTDPPAETTGTNPKENP